jgi:hypothetical protein
MVCRLLLAQVHVQSAHIFRHGLITAIADLPIAEGLGPFPFGEILDEKARPVVVAEIA